MLKIQSYMVWLTPSPDTSILICICAMQLPDMFDEKVALIGQDEEFSESRTGSKVH